MSEANVELVRSSVEALRRHGADAYLEFMAEDVEVHPDSSRFPEAKPFRGREEFRRFFAEIDQGWEGGASTGVIRGNLFRGRPGYSQGRLGRQGPGQRYRPALQPDRHLHRPRGTDHQGRVLLRPRSGPRSR